MSEYERQAAATAARGERALADVMRRLRRGSQSFHEEMRSARAHWFRRWSLHAAALDDPRIETAIVDRTMYGIDAKTIELPAIGPAGHACSLGLWAEFVWFDYMARGYLGEPETVAPDSTVNGKPVHTTKPCPRHVRDHIEHIKRKHRKEAA